MSARDVRAAKRAEKREAADREASIRAEALFYSPRETPEYKKIFGYYEVPRVWVRKDGEYVEIP